MRPRDVMSGKLASLLVPLAAVCTGIAGGAYFENSLVITWAGIVGLFITTYLAQQKASTLHEEMHNGTFEGIVKGQVKEAVTEMAEDPQVPAVEINDRREGSGNG